MAQRKRFSPEVRELAVRVVRGSLPQHSSEWAAIRSIAERIGCTPETLRKWVRTAQVDSGERGGNTTTERDRIRDLERENLELKRANESLRNASACFAQAELDRRWR